MAESLSQQTQKQAEKAKRQRVIKAIDETVHKLTAQQRTAVIEYLCGESQVRSCEIAGYKNVRSQASRVFSNKKVQAVIDEYFHGGEMDARQWVQRMSEQATAVYAQYYYWDEGREELAIDVQGMLADGYGYLIKGVKYAGKDAEVQVVEFQPTFDAQMAIARYLGLLGAKGTEDDPIQVAPVRIIEVVGPEGEGG